MKKVFAIISIARQVNGEYCVLKVEKAYSSAVKAEDQLKTMLKNYAESIQTPSGILQCVCERGVFEIDVEE
jgi:hypothetical protein